MTGRFLFLRKTRIMSKLLIPEFLKEKNGKVYWCKESLGFTPIDKVRKLFELNGLQGEALEILVKEYKNETRTCVKYKCKKCENVVIQVIKNLIKGDFCPFCGKIKMAKTNTGKQRTMNSPKTKEEAQNLVGENFTILEIGKLGKNKSLIAKCIHCSAITEKTVGTWRKTPTCKKCNSVKQATGLQEFIKLANEVHSNLYLYDNAEYINCHRRVTITCKKHGNFNQTPKNHLRGDGCPNCHTSKGELAIRKFLISKGFIPEFQKTYDDCVYESKLRFDFFVKELNLLIEAQGSQHYVHNPLFHRKGNTLESQQQRDAIKREYCKTNNIQLLEIDLRKEQNYEEVFKPYIERLQTNELCTSS